MVISRWPMVTPWHSVMSVKARMGSQSLGFRNRFTGFKASAQKYRWRLADTSIAKNYILIISARRAEPHEESVYAL